MRFPCFSNALPRLCWDAGRCPKKTSLMLNRLSLAFLRQKFVLIGQIASTVGQWLLGFLIAG
jgi:hypothetical protein